MALGTIQIRMFSDQRESGFVVIESHIAPTAGVVAGSAICAELSVVIVFSGMAGITICRCTFIDAIGMTGGTLHIVVSS